jgi:hypothetical protein
VLSASPWGRRSRSLRRRSCSAGRARGSTNDLDSLEKWCEASGLGESWARHVAAPFVPDAERDLARVAELDDFFRFELPAAAAAER